MNSGNIKIGLLIVLIITFLCYSGLLYTRVVQPVGVSFARADVGKHLWQAYNCQACHQVYGLGGYLGPDLTNEYSTRGPDLIKAFLKSGTNVMPDFHFTDVEIQALTDYLQSIDATGIADPKHFTTNYDGTIQ